jgi:cellulose synthase/poly-beta-1,6-N-acetylglucosamine synthase-like glycosyltransferase
MTGSSAPGQEVKSPPVGLPLPIVCPTETAPFSTKPKQQVNSTCLGPPTSIVIEAAVVSQGLRLRSPRTPANTPMSPNTSTVRSRNTSSPMTPVRDPLPPVSSNAFGSPAASHPIEPALAVPPAPLVHVLPDVVVSVFENGKQPIKEGKECKYCELYMPMIQMAHALHPVPVLKDAELARLTEQLEWIGWRTPQDLCDSLTSQKANDMAWSGDFTPLFIRVLVELRKRANAQKQHEQKEQNDNKVTDPDHVTTVTHFVGGIHYSPDATTNYFAAIMPKVLTQIEGKEDTKMMTVIVPFFNEPREEMERTLMSLGEQTPDLEMLGIRVHILLVGDGWFKAHPSTQQYLAKLFCIDNLAEHFKESKESKEAKQVKTVVVQRHKGILSSQPLDSKDSKDSKDLKDWKNENNGPELVPISIKTRSGPVKLFLSLLYKADNRRKHNSHGWFLSAFASRYRSDYVFLTDCGTLFSRHCLLHLVHQLATDPELSAVSGKQRVMTAEQQGNENETLLQRISRAAQLYDYESSTAAYTGAFSALGMLPVIPGPCGLYRYDSVRESAIPYYLETLHRDPNEMELVDATLALAEDRILSYAAVTRGKAPAMKTAFVPEAIFYFEAETEPSKLLTQRRRWINGTIAGYIWLLQNVHLLVDCGLNVVQKGGLILLIACQLVMYVMMALAPALFTITLRLALREQIWHLSEMTQQAVWGSYGLLYVIFVLLHARLSGTKKVIDTLYHLAVIVNMAMMTFIIVWQILIDISYGFTLSLIFILANAAFPFLLALIHSPLSFLYMLQSFVPFLLYLPTMIVYFGAYSFARVHDLSWGNRPSENVENFANGSSSVGSGSVNPNHRSSPEELAAVKRKILKTSRWICGSILVGNGVFVLVFVDILNSGGITVLLVLSVFLFGFALMQMVLSLIFFIMHNASRLKLAFACCFHVACCCKSRASFYRERVLAAASKQ